MQQEACPTSALLSNGLSAQQGLHGLRLQKTWEDLGKIEAKEREQAEEEKLLAKKKVDAWCKKHGYKGVHSTKMTFKGAKKYALHTAVKHKDVEMVRLLLACGADKRAKNSNGQTPFDLASTFDKATCKGELRSQLLAALR
jgi:hypothetical protein